MSSAQTEARAIAALFDDIYVRDGFCDWADVANARDEVLRLVATALAAKEQFLSDEYDARIEAIDRAERLERQLAEANKALGTIHSAEATNTDVLVGTQAFVDAGPNNHIHATQFRAALNAVFAARRAREQGGE